MIPPGFKEGICKCGEKYLYVGNDIGYCVKCIDGMEEKDKTMHEEYGEPNDKSGKHICCSKCGHCKTCGCASGEGCSKKIEGEN